ncbi:MAG: alpha/beta fold hydrolase [Planctomycetes bacterium]|nr:alpha/beta fold hydrolase [Planctomycetota bacterium]
METRFLSFDHVRLAVHVAGRGPVAILIHGYPLDHRLWLDALRGPLAAARTLVAVDLRGHGLSPWCGDPVHAMDLFADDVAAVAHTIADEPVDVVGLSMGGYVAQALWARHPELVRSLALVDTRARADDEAAKAGRDAAMRTVVEQGRSAIAAVMLPKLLAPCPAGDPSGLLLRARVSSMIEGTVVETIVADLRGLRERPDRTGMLPTIAVPALVVAGELDTIAPPAEAHAMAAAIPGARCVVVPRAGHLVPIEDPASFARELGRFWGAMG